MKVLLSIVSLIGILLGGLWLVQGLGLVTIAPILCVAECEPLEGPAPLWAIVGLVLLVAGVLGLYRVTRRR